VACVAADLIPGGECENWRVVNLGRWLTRQSV
jgi:hypothetical protein